MVFERMEEGRALGLRIKEARKKIRLSQAELGKELDGQSKQSVSGWEIGNHAPPIHLLRQLQKLTMVNYDWLLEGVGQRDIEPNVSVTGLMNGRRVPIVSHSEAKNLIKQGEFETEPSNFTTAHTEVSENSYALRIADSSMEPEFRKGDVVIIDRSIDPLPGDFVSVLLGNEETVRFLKFRPRDEGKVELLPQNDDWPTCYIDEERPGIVDGVMVQQIRFRAP